MSRKWLFVVLVFSLLAAACSQIGGSNIVPTTGDTANDPAAVQRFIPNLSNYGYQSVAVDNVQTAISGVSGGAALLTGNPAAAALIAQIDGMITCYRNVGALDARVYYNISTVVQGQIPSAGALAVINQDRLVNNFLSCALNNNQGFSAQAVQPCSGSGSIVVDGQTISYLYAGTDATICQLMATPFNQ